MKYKNKAIEFTYPLRITKSHLSHLHIDFQTGLILLCHAVNELNFLMRLSVDCHHEATGDDIIEARLHGSHLMVNRMISSKTFELVKMLEGCLRSNIDEAWKDSCRSLLDSIGTIQKEAREISRRLRNGVSNHYSFGDTKRMLAFIPDDTILDFQITEKIGNNYFPAADSVLTYGNLMEHGKEMTFEESKEAINEWQDLSIKIIRSLNSFFYRMLADHVIFHHPHKRLVKKTHFVPYDMISIRNEPKLSLFFRDKIGD